MSVARRGCPAFVQAIWEDNQQFWRERNIFDDAYYEFMLSLVSAGSTGEALPYVAPRQTAPSPVFLAPLLVLSPSHDSVAW